MNATLLFVLSSTLVAATPLLIGALGELAVEKTGVLNLSIEGLMAIGAAIGFITTHDTGSHWLGLLTGGVAGLLLSLVFAGIILGFLANQVAAGIAVGILGLGLSAMVGRSYESQSIPAMAHWAIPGLSTLPVVGPALFAQSPPVYLAVLLAVGEALFFRFTRLGLVVRATGEAPNAAHALGYDVRLIRAGAIAFGGFLAGVAGAFISVAYTPLWADGMVAGRGWIVIALVVFGSWRVGRIVAGAYLFGAVGILELLFQAEGVQLPSQLLSSLPYVATIIALALLSMDRRRVRLNAPVSLGLTFWAGQ
jgi:general nucleoside transport system permease protein